MDTFRVQLPQPQPVTNEEEFITNSGRKVKRPVVDITPEPKLLIQSRRDEDIDGSGISVMSLTPGDSLSARDDNLSNSVQAELHLSLDRLSENYDPEEFKRLEEKSKNSRLILTERERNKSQLVMTSNEERQGDKELRIDDQHHNLMFTDSLNAEDSLSHATPQRQEELENSEEFIVSEEDEEHTVVGDSLNYLSSREGTTMSSKQSNGGAYASKETPVNSNHHPTDDKYADLRYNPNWREVEAKKPKPPPTVIDFTSAPRLDDSLDQPLNSHRGGGEILVHKKELYSPIIPEWGKEKMALSNPRSISPTRLSADPQKLMQTNARYEEEFNRMLKAEVLNEGNESPIKDEHTQYSNSFQDASLPRKESYSVLIRKLDSQDPSKPTMPSGFPEESSKRIGGYQLLPDRHRIPSPTHDQSSQEITSPGSQQRTSKMSRSPRYQISPEGYYAHKKDPLSALSPRDKRRNPLAPTPPKVPKPKNVDFIEMNKLRVGRKTNSAGYLEIHKKRSRKVDQDKSRSKSEIRGPIAQPNHGEEMQSPNSEFPIGPVEGLWEKQAERLKIAKGENLNKGKVLRPSPNSWQNHPSHHGSTVSVSPKQRGQSWNGSYMGTPADNAWVIENQKLIGWAPSHESAYRSRHPLPVPSQQAPQPSPRRYQSNAPVNRDELMDTLLESGYRRAYFSPRMNCPPSEEDSPMMKAYHSKYSTEVFEPAIFMNSGNVLRQNHSDQNLSLSTRDIVNGNAEVWTNPDLGNELPPHLPPSNHSHGRPNRKVTFFGENEPITIGGISNGDPVPTPPPGAMYRLNRYKFPLPPTPPFKSQRHALTRGHRQPEEKENEGYYDVREDNFPILPPILKSHHKMSPLKQSPNNQKEDSPNSPGKGSYLEQHEKQKKKFEYKTYTLDDYKNLKKDVKLGGLGPDLESARKKMEKTERAKQYAELIRKEHKSNAAGLKSKEQFGSTADVSYYDDNYRFTTNIDENQRREMLEKRNRALEYSKNIPKPKPKLTPSKEEIETSPTLSGFTQSQTPAEGSKEPEGVDFNWGLLQMLKDRHEKEKAQVAAFAGKS